MDSALRSAERFCSFYSCQWLIYFIFCFLYWRLSNHPQTGVCLWAPTSSCPLGMALASTLHLLPDSGEAGWPSWLGSQGSIPPIIAELSSWECWRGGIPLHSPEGIHAPFYSIHVYWGLWHAWHCARHSKNAKTWGHSPAFHDLTITLGGTPCRPQAVTHMSMHTVKPAVCLHPHLPLCAPTRGHTHLHTSTKAYGNSHPHAYKHIHQCAQKHTHNQAPPTVQRVYICTHKHMLLYTHRWGS